MTWFEDALKEAKVQLPRAFTVGGMLPFGNPVRLGGATLSAAGDSPLLPTPDEDIASVESANEEEGFEALAFYVSFHSPTPKDEWGIFYCDQPMRRFAAKVMRDLRVSDPRQAAVRALEIVRRHELFHFRFDLYALHQELTIHQPLYNRYSQNVYPKVFRTSDCYEESLANRACVRAQYQPEGVEGSRMREFVSGWCKKAPPGYRDFDRAPTDLRSGVGGQLRFGQVAARLPVPQAEWVGWLPQFWDRRRRFCPEYVLLTPPVSKSGVLHLIVKARGNLWVFHKYDPDPWPSRPHGHNRETGDKLDVRDGRVYDRNRQPAGRLNNRELTFVHEELNRRWPDVTIPVQ
ncbi:MAG: hypothetical protein AAB225_14495 [Acidobacteriota bacterium]